MIAKISKENIEKLERIRKAIRAEFPHSLGQYDLEFTVIDATVFGSTPHI